MTIDWNRRTNRFVDSEFGRKIDEVAMAKGHLYPAYHFEPAALAKHLGEPDSDYVSGIRSGKRTARISDLPKIIEYFDLVGKVYPEDFKLPLADFKRLLVEGNVGIYGQGNAAKVRAELVMFAKEQAQLPSAQRLHMRLEVIQKVSERAGGLAGSEVDDDEGPVPVLATGWKCRLTVTVPKEGHLIVLDEQLDKETLSLCPSTYHVVTKVPEGEAVIPDDGGTITIGKRYTGPFRLLVVLSDQPLPTPWFEVGHKKTPPPRVDDHHWVQLHRDIQASPAESIRVATLDYDVKEGGR